MCSVGSSATHPGYMLHTVARVAKSVAAADLKSAVPQGAWGFESLPGHPVHSRASLPPCVKTGDMVDIRAGTSLTLFMG